MKEEANFLMRFVLVIAAMMLFCDCTRPTIVGERDAAEFDATAANDSSSSVSDFSTFDGRLLEDASDMASAMASDSAVSSDSATPSIMVAGHSLIVRDAACILRDIRTTASSPAILELTDEVDLCRLRGTGLVTPSAVRLYIILTEFNGVGDVRRPTPGTYTVGAFGAFARRAEVRIMPTDSQCQTTLPASMATAASGTVEVTRFFTDGPSGTCTVDGTLDLVFGTQGDRATYGPFTANPCAGIRSEPSSC